MDKHIDRLKVLVGRTLEGEVPVSTNLYGPGASQYSFAITGFERRLDSVDRRMEWYITTGTLTVLWANDTRTTVVVDVQKQLDEWNTILERIAAANGYGKGDFIRRDINSRYAKYDGLVRDFNHVSFVVTQEIIGKVNHLAFKFLNVKKNFVLNPVAGV